MPTSVPVPTKSSGDLLTSSLWNSYVRDNVNKLLERGHRVLTVAQFAALTGLEGTKGTVAPDEVYLEVDATNGILWHLGYESGETTYKWRSLGGCRPLHSEVTTSESTTSATYAALTTAGPSIALPRAGDYDVEHGGNITAQGNIAARMSYDIGGTGAVDADCVRVDAPSASGGASTARRRRKAALTSVTLTSKYKTSTGTSVFEARWISVSPVRIRHDA